jgi:hypothetical protein
MTSELGASSAHISTGQVAMFYQVQKFNKAIWNDNPDASCLWSTAKKAMCIALPIVILINLISLPFIVLWNCCQSNKGGSPSSTSTSDVVETSILSKTTHEIHCDRGDGEILHRVHNVVSTPSGSTTQITQTVETDTLRQKRQELADKLALLREQGAGF